MNVDDTPSSGVQMRRTGAPRRLTAATATTQSNVDSAVSQINTILGAQVLLPCHVRPLGACGRGRRFVERPIAQAHPALWTLSHAAPRGARAYLRPAAPAAVCGAGAGWSMCHSDLRPSIASLAWMAHYDDYECKYVREDVPG